MRIKAVKICGFRGIPPKVPPDLDLEFASGEKIVNTIIYGPNAFGKSSIADALEWFFKEDVRANDYFEEYTDRDNVHVNLGQPPNEHRAFIELELIHNNHTYTVSKTLDHSGVKTHEDLSDCKDLIKQAQDELIVLDHDKFREFVCAASKDKWSTFSSLIGYEELEKFRGGLDSLTLASLSKWLRINQLQDDAEKKRHNWQIRAQKAVQDFELADPDNPLRALEVTFMQDLERTLRPLQVPVPTGPSQINPEFWDELRQQIQPPEDAIDPLLRLGEIERLLAVLPPFDESFEVNITTFQQNLSSLEEKKEHFDKQVLAEFYDRGFQVISEGKTEKDRCPFCELRYEWSPLESNVSQRLSLLNIDTMRADAEKLHKVWRQLEREVSTRTRSARNADLSSINDVIRQLPAEEEIDAALEMTTFNYALAIDWIETSKQLAQIVVEEVARLKKDKIETQMLLADDPIIQLAEAVEHLSNMWQTWLDLSRMGAKIRSLEQRIQITGEVVQTLRDVVSSFRSELGDFSSRVVELINDDVAKYYSALHQGDNVQPYLETGIVGQQRRVKLKCDYWGVTDRDAASLLSESHRNSLGLAIMLAFMKYKRLIGSPIDFLILDDVTQSFNVGHRLSLINFLGDSDFSEISESQIIFLTHDRTFADLVVRPGEKNSKWLRYDIRNWQLHNMLIEPCDKDIFQRAEDHLKAGDEIAAAIYGRHALEQIYKGIVEKARILMPYNPKPWKTSLDVFQSHIAKTVERLWNEEMTVDGPHCRKGFVSPDAINLDELKRSLRLLHLTVHESDFLDNPPSIQDVNTALNAVRDLYNAFTCPNCHNKSKSPYFHSLSRDKQGNVPVCKDCSQKYPEHIV